QLAVELDGECVHRDGADRSPELAGDPDLGSGQVAAEAVRVADRDDADPCRALGDEAAAVPGALAGRELPDLCKVARPAERRLEPVLAGIRAEGREAVDRDSAAGRVEARVGEPEGAGAVGEVARQVPVR